jgi:hypothetical protein
MRDVKNILIKIIPRQSWISENSQRGASEKVDKSIASGANVERILRVLGGLKDMYNLFQNCLFFL